MTTTETGATAPAPSPLAPWIERWSAALPELVGINPNPVIAARLLDFAASEMMREKDGPLWRAERERDAAQAEIRRYVEWVDNLEQAADKAAERHTETEEALDRAQLALTGPKVEFHQQDFIPGFAAFLPDATTPAPDSKAFCVLNLGSLLAGVQLGDVPASDVPYAVAECMMHEVMHALEQWAKVEFSEDRIEALLERYRARFGVGDSAVPDDATEPFTSDQIRGLRDAAFHMDGAASLAQAADYVEALYDLAADLAYPPRSMTGLFARLTPEQKQAALAYQGPENIGTDEFRLDASVTGPVSQVHAGDGGGQIAGRRTDLEEEMPTTALSDPFGYLEMAFAIVEESGPDLPVAVACIYDAAISIASVEPPVPLAGTEPWVEGDDAYLARIGCDRCLVIDGELRGDDFERRALSLPRARLVPAERMG